MRGGMASPDAGRPLTVMQGLLPGQMSDALPPPPHQPPPLSAPAQAGCGDNSPRSRDSLAPRLGRAGSNLVSIDSLRTIQEASVDDSGESLTDAEMRQKSGRVFNTESTLTSTRDTRNGIRNPLRACSEEDPSLFNRTRLGAKGFDLKKGASVRSARSSFSGRSFSGRESGGSNIAVTQSLSPTTLSSITYQDGVSVRAIDLRKVMRGFAAIFSSPAGDDSDSGAEEVPHIRTFISHNWSLPRFQKFLMLAVSRNSCCATFAAIAVSLICCTLVALGQLPVYESVRFQGDEVVERSMYTPVLSTFSFIVVLLCAHEVDCCNRHPVFLDKACISQADPEMQRKGIESIGAFLYHCEKMLVLYSDAYLQRLWTVFELGLFLTLRQGAPIVVVPVFMPTLVIGGFLLCSCNTIGVEVLQMRYVVERYPDANSLMQRALLFSVLTLTGALAGYVLRRWARESHNIHKYAEDFSIRKATCANEKDRDLIQGNVIAYLRDLTVVESSCSDDDVLDTFDRLVAKTVPRVLEKSLGRIGIPYCHVIMMQLSMAVSTLEALSVDVRNREPLAACSLNLALELVLLAAVHPLLLAALARILSAQLRLTGLQDACYSYGSSLAAAVCMFLASQAGQALRDEAKSDSGALALFILASAVVLAATFYVYGRRASAAGVLRPCSDGFLSLS